MLTKLNDSQFFVHRIIRRISRYDGNENENIYALFLGNDFSRIDDIRRREAGTPLEPRCFQTIPFHVRGLIKQRSLRTHRGWFSAPFASRFDTGNARSIHFWWEFMFSPTAQNGSHRTATPWGNSTRGRRETRGNPRAWEKSAKV